MISAIYKAKLLFGNEHKLYLMHPEEAEEFNKTQTDVIAGEPNYTFVTNVSKVPLLSEVNSRAPINARRYRGEDGLIYEVSSPYSLAKVVDISGN